MNTSTAIFTNMSIRIPIATATQSTNISTNTPINIPTATFTAIIRKKGNTITHPAAITTTITLVMGTKPVITTDPKGGKDPFSGYRRPCQVNLIELPEVVLVFLVHFLPSMGEHDPCETV
jgi:hypothetical protein